MTSQNRSGFTLVEVIVTVVLLGIVLSSLGRMSTAISLTARKNDLVAHRAAVMQLEANKFSTMRYDSLATFVKTAKTFTWGGFRYSRALTITTPSLNHTEVKVVVTPANTAIKADSVVIERGKPSTSTSLCTTC